MNPDNAKPTPEPPKKSRPTLIEIVFILILLGLLAALTFPTIGKPVIYLYPEHEQETEVRLDYAGKLIALYPEMDKALGGWKVTAHPDGRLVDTRDGKEYSYLFWEGEGDNHWDLSTGFVVKGADTKAFL